MKTLYVSVLLLVTMLVSSVSANELQRNTLTGEIREKPGEWIPLNSQEKEAYLNPGKQIPSGFVKNSYERVDFWNVEIISHHTQALVFVDSTFIYENIDINNEPYTVPDIVRILMVISTVCMWGMVLIRLRLVYLVLGLISVISNMILAMCVILSYGLYWPEPVFILAIVVFSISTPTFLYLATTRLDIPYSEIGTGADYVVRKRCLFSTILCTIMGFGVFYLI